MGLNRGVPSDYGEFLAKINSVESMVNRKTRKFEIDDILNPTTLKGEKLENKKRELLKTLMDNTGFSYERVVEILNKAN